MNDVREDIQIINLDGTVSIRETFSIVFYIKKPNLEIVQNIDSAIARFADMVSINALPSCYNYDGEQENLTEESLHDLIFERLHGPDRAASANIELIGKGVHAPDFYLRYYGSSLEVPGLEDEVSYLWCRVPRNFFISRMTQIMDFIMEFADKLPITFAHASLSLSGENQYKKQELAKSFPGLDISDPGCIRADLGNKAAGSYWLTLLGSELCNAVGGTAALRAKLPKEISVKELLNGKCRILLSAKPEAGDVKRGRLLPMNRSLAGFFQDKGVLHNPNKVVYFVDKDGLADRGAMEAWHKRFLAG